MHAMRRMPLRSLRTVCAGGEVESSVGGGGEQFPYFTRVGDKAATNGSVEPEAERIVLVRQRRSTGARRR